MTSWLGSDQEDPASLDAILSLRPELVERYRTFYRSFWADGLVPRRILELCRLRIAAIHDCDGEWAIRDEQVPLSSAELEALESGVFDDFAADERAALRVAEQMPHRHHEISDDDVAELNEVLGAPGAVAALTAVAFFDVSSRLRLLWGVPRAPLALSDPPLEDGQLP